MNQKSKKPYKINPLIPAAIALAWIVGVCLYFSVLPLLLPAIGVATGVGLLIIGGYYGYKAIRKAYDARKNKSIHLPELPPEPDKEYVYTPKLEPQADPGKYTPAKATNLHKQKQFDPNLLTLISQNLTPREAALFKPVDKTLNQDISFKNHKPTQELLKYIGTPEQTFEEKLALFKAACDEIKKTYPQALIDACGIHTLAALPVLNLKDRDHLHDYIDFLKPEHLKGYKAMRGVDTHKRAFISVCIDTPTGPYVKTAFQRYTDDKLMWQVAGHAFVPHVNHPNMLAVYKDILAEARDESQNKLFNCLADLLHGTHKTDSLTDQRSKPESSPNIS